MSCVFWANWKFWFNANKQHSIEVCKYFHKTLLVRLAAFATPTRPLQSSTTYVCVSAVEVWGDSVADCILQSTFMPQPSNASHCLANHHPQYLIYIARIHLSSHKLLQMFSTCYFIESTALPSVVACEHFYSFPILLPFCFPSSTNQMLCLALPYL